MTMGRRSNSRLPYLLDRMTRIVYLICSMIGVVHATYNFTFNGNPWITHTTAADPDAHVWDGTVYVYCSKDGNLRLHGLGNTAFSYEFMDGYNVFSSTDMVNWVDHGEIFHSRNSPWGPPGWMWAPSAHWNGKYGDEGLYYLYYPHQDWDGVWRIGVATAPSPVGPFTDIGTPIDGVTGIDPRLFIDDDQQAYLYYNSAMVVKMKPNLLEVAETPRNIDYGANNMEDKYHFEEGSYLHKYNGMYYYSYSNWKAEVTTAYYGIGTSPYGPFEWKGALSGRKSGSQDHHSIIEFKGTWYYFFHRDTFSEEKTALDWYGHRRISCYETMTYNDDGTIQQVDPTSWIMNAGGGPVLANDGTMYNWDQWYSDGTSQSESLTTQISGTTDDALYQSCRFSSSFSYNVPMANGDYVVTVKFAELLHSDSGKRVFKVNMENSTKILNLDVFALVGSNAAYDETHTVSVYDNELSLDFIASVDSAMVSAVDVRPASKPTPVPTMPPSMLPTTLAPTTMEPTALSIPKLSSVPTILTPSPSVGSTIAPKTARPSSTSTDSRNQTTEPTRAPTKTTNIVSSLSPTVAPSLSSDLKYTESPSSRPASFNSTDEKNGSFVSVSSPVSIASIILAVCLICTIPPFVWKLMGRPTTEVGLKRFVEDLVESYRELDHKKPFSDDASQGTARA